MKQLEKKDCTQCGKSGHNALYCAGEAVTSDPSTSSKDAKVASTASKATSTPKADAKAEASISSISNDTFKPSPGFVTELDDRDLDTWTVTGSDDEH